MLWFGAIQITLNWISPQGLEIELFRFVSVELKQRLDVDMINFRLHTQTCNDYDLIQLFTVSDSYRTDILIGSLFQKTHLLSSVSTDIKSGFQTNASNELFWIDLDQTLNFKASFVNLIMVNTAHPDWDTMSNKMCPRVIEPTWCVWCLVLWDAVTYVAPISLSARKAGEKWYWMNLFMSSSITSWISVEK